MASYGLGKDYGKTLALIRAGFYEFSRTSVSYIAKVPFAHKLAVVGTLVISTIVMGSLQLGRKMQNSKSGGDGMFQKLKKSRVGKISLNAVDHLLSVVENLILPGSNKKNTKASNDAAAESSICPEINGVPKLMSLRVISNSSLGTPHNKGKPSENEDWTPYSSVSAVDESVFDRSCVSLMEDLSQSTIPTPIRDLRQQMAFKIRMWRLAIRDLDTPEFPTWSPDPAHRVRQDGFTARLLNFLSSILPVRFSRSISTAVPGSGRKRKRIDADDDDLAMYIPHSKGQSKLNGRALTGTDPSPSFPGIRGLSVVPIIGNWFSAEPSQSHTKQDETEQLDHISLIQRDFISPSKHASDSTSDSEAYEILDMEAKNPEGCVSPERKQ